MKYTISYGDDARRQLKALGQRDRNVIEDAIAQHLAHQPDTPSSKRKRLRPNRVAEWQLRVGKAWRVLYNIYPDRVEVVIIAIGWKPRETLYIDGEVVEL